MLTDSISACVCGSFDHYVVVHKQDLELFRAFRRGRTHLLSDEEILHGSLEFTVSDEHLGRYRYRNKPLSGWSVQQLTKLAAPEISDAVIFVLLDSDFFFLKPLDPHELFTEERLPLFCLDDGGAMYARYPSWYDNASRLTAYPKNRSVRFNYVTKPIYWLRSCVVQLRERIERAAQRPWQDALLDSQEFSEYTLYGMYVENTPEEKNRHRLTPNWRTRIKYSFVPQSTDTVVQYLSRLEQDVYGIAVHRSCGIPVNEYRPVVETLWEGIGED